MMAKHSLSLLLRNEDDTERLGILLGKTLSKPKASGACVYLLGDLGSGKTTLTRYILQGAGHAGVVKSPTYTLVEPYELAHGNVYHFDLYRLSDPGELEYLGVDDYFLAKDSLCIVEWPGRGEGFLPLPDIRITLDYENGDNDQSSRRAFIESLNPDYIRLVSTLENEFYS